MIKSGKNDNTTSTVTLDSHKRSITKALIYRGSSFIILGFLSWITTQDIIQVSIITIGYQLLSMLGYYFYERVWNCIKWGKY